MRKIILSCMCILSMNSYSKEVISSYKVSRANKNLQRIADSFEIKKKLNNSYVVYVIKEKTNDFKLLAPNAKLLDLDINKSIRDKELNGYHTFSEVVSKYNDLAKEFSDIAKIEKYGVSKKGLPLFAIKISDNVNLDEKEPKLMFTSATHGDELITVEVQMSLVEELLRNFHSDPRLKRMIEEKQLYFIPVVNPDGFSKRSRYSSGRVDPNRDYPWPKKPNRVNKVTCIKHLMNFYNKHDFSGSMDIHASGKMIMFPWAYTRKSIANSDFKFMDNLTTSMAKTNNYKHGPISKVIYVAKGSSADYYYWKNNGVALAIELTTTKAPASSKIPLVVDEAREMIWQFIEAF